MRPEGEDDKKKSIGERFAEFRSSFSAFMYSKNEEGEGVVMGRTALSWGKIGLFFFIYYACLAAFFAAIFAIAFSTMPATNEGPKYTAFLDDKPFLYAYPSEINSYTKTKVNGTIEYYNRFLKEYREQNTACYAEERCSSASDNTYRLADEKKQCRFDMQTLGDCESQWHYGFQDGAPCVFFKLSKIFHWKPEPNSGAGNYVQLKCETSGSDDVVLTQYPEADKAFPISFWPYRGESYYMLPIAAVKVKSADKVRLKCKAVGANIEHSDTYKLDKGAIGQVEVDVYPGKD